MIRSDGRAVDAQEFDVDLRLVSLHKSLPQEWPHQFQHTLNGRARVNFSRRSQLEDILKGLGRSRWGFRCLPCAQPLGKADKRYLAAPKRSRHVRLHLTGFRYIASASRGCKVGPEAAAAGMQPSLRRMP